MIEGQQQPLSSPLPPVAEARPAGPVMGGPYWFNPSQKQAIGSLSRYMRIVGILMLVIALLNFVLGALVATRLDFFVQGIVLMIMGLVTLKAASRFKHVTQSQNTGINHLMIAIGDLKFLYVVQTWLIGLTIAFIVTVFLAFVALR